MLNRRQIQIIEFLERRQIATGAEIADKMRTSKRTIMRDIAQINHAVDGFAAVINDGKGYQLEIQNKECFLQVLDSSSLDNELILLALLLKDFVTLDDFSEQLYISKPTLTEYIVNLREQYKNRLKIKSKPNLGHFLDEPFSRKLILLANIIDQNPNFFCVRLSISMVQYTKLVNAIRAHYSELAYPNVHSSHLASLFLSALVLTGQHGDMTLKQEQAGSIYGMMFIEADMEFTLETTTALQKFLDEQFSYAQLITIEKIWDVMLLIEQEYQVQICDMELVTHLVDHLKRSIAYPQILFSSRGYQLEEMKALYPLAFDLSIQFVELISKKFQLSFYNIDLIGLYFSSAIARNKQKAEKIILFSEQYAVASINKIKIEQKIPEVEVIIVHRKTELADVIKTGDGNLLINNQDTILYLEESMPVIDVKQIIGTNELVQIEAALKRINIQKNIHLYFQKENSFTFETSRTDIWRDIIERVCRILSEKGILLLHEEEKIIEREHAGNNLVINHIAIPHCTTNRGIPFFSIFVHLTNPVIVEGEIVHNLLLSCMNTNIQTGLKIFNYLYHTLSELESEKMLSIQTYDQFIELLK